MRTWECSIIIYLIHDIIIAFHIIESKLEYLHIYQLISVFLQTKINRHPWLDSQVAGIPINAPYIVTVIGDMSFEMIIVCERIPLIKSSDVLAILICLVSAYFTFNMEYPPSLKSVLLFKKNMILESKTANIFPIVFCKSAAL